MGRLADKMKVIRVLKAEASPAWPLILDSLLLQRRSYVATHSATGLSFDLHPGCGDWFTFYECCIRQDYFPEELEIGPGDQILDIGGNFGAFSLLAARRVGPEGCVHCYEPSPVSAERIRGHIACNGARNIRLAETAVGGAADEIELHLHRKSALSTTKADIDGRSSEDLKSINVQQITIDDVLKGLPGPIALVKIDCEGSEYEIVEQMDPSDLARIRAIVIETHTVPGRDRREILSKLRENGFDITDGNPFLAINARPLEAPAV